MDLDELIELNKKALWEKISSCRSLKDGRIMCNDFIEAVSEKKETDKRLISDYTSDEIIVAFYELECGFKQCRFFTQSGIRRFVQEGHLYNYENVCEYFQIEKRDLMLEDFKKKVAYCIKTDRIKKHTLLKWLFNKRKTTKTLSDELSYEEIFDWLITCDDSSIDEIKQQWLIRYIWESI